MMKTTIKNLTVYRIKSVCSDDCLFAECANDHQVTEFAYSQEIDDIFVVVSLEETLGNRSPDFIMDELAFYSLKNIIVYSIQQGNREAFEETMNLRDSLVSLINKEIEN